MTLTHNNHYSEDSLIIKKKTIYDRKSTYKICFTIICRSCKKRRTNFFNLIWCGDRNIYFSLKICVFLWVEFSQICCIKSMSELNLQKNI